MIEHGLGAGAVRRRHEGTYTPDGPGRNALPFKHRQLMRLCSSCRLEDAPALRSIGCTNLCLNGPELRQAAVRTPT